MFLDFFLKIYYVIFERSLTYKLTECTYQNSISLKIILDLPALTTTTLHLNLNLYLISEVRNGNQKCPAFHASSFNPLCNQPTGHSSYQPSAHSRSQPAIRFRTISSLCAVCLSCLNFYFTQVRHSLQPPSQNFDRSQKFSDRPHQTPAPAVMDIL